MTGYWLQFIAFNCMIFTCWILIVEKMTKWIEQQNSIIFCQKLRDFKIETIGKIQQTFSNYSIEISQIINLINQF